MINFSADEIFEIAEQIERNGAEFYREAAKSIGGEIHDLLLLLAGMEDDHEKTFSEMRKKLSSTERSAAVFDPDGQLPLYLQAFADGHVFDTKVDPAEFLGDGKTPREVLTKAIQLEKDSIVFYLGIRYMVPERLGGGWVEDIMKEEIRHIGLLGKQLTELQQGTGDD